MMLLSHPTGNTFVRAILAGLQEEDLLTAFYTTLAVDPTSHWIRLLPETLRREWLRRTYPIPRAKLHTHSLREGIRLAASRLAIPALSAHETGWASVDGVYQDLDRHVSQRIRQDRIPDLRGVYCYEDAALETFRAAKQRNLTCFYDLPIAYWETSQRLLKEEADRYPDWSFTLVGTRDSVAKLARKSEELALADVVICPSQFVYDSLPRSIQHSKPCVVAPFGSPDLHLPPKLPRSGSLRILFAGSLSQRKGLADLFEAMKLLDRTDVELVVMGSLLLPMEFYRACYPSFIYEPPRPHQAVLELMQTCDVLVLPSIVEGRALVQQEAMSCGLPLIITPHTGGEDLIESGQTGFMVPIRSPEALADRIRWFADHRDRIPEMAAAAKHKAATVSWDRYRQILLGWIKPRLITS